MGDNIGIVGVALAGVAVILIVIMSIVMFLMYKKMRRLERRLRSVTSSGKNTSTVAAVDEEKSFEMSPVKQQGKKTSIPTPQLSRPMNVRSDHSYENTQILDSTEVVTPSRKTTGEPSGNYTAVPDSLPSFLRNQEMLVLPEVSEDVVQSAQKDFDESYARLSKIKINNLNDEYMDPQDARDKACSTKTHEKLDQRVSKSKVSSGVSEANTPDPSSSPTSKKIHVANREDYSMVSDALPEKEMRPRTTSDVSPVKKITPNLKKKSESLKHTEPHSQPLKRRSTVTTKEVVTFDPKAGFKLTAKRTASDGSPHVSKPKESLNNSAPSSPAEEKKPPLPDVGGKHVYAAVDLTAKCRPERDIIRREGVGTPDHYVACM